MTLLDLYIFKMGNKRKGDLLFTKQSYLDLAKKILFFSFKGESNQPIVISSTVFINIYNRLR